MKISDPQIDHVSELRPEEVPLYCFFGSTICRKKVGLIPQHWPDHIVFNSPFVAGAIVIFCLHGKKLPLCGWPSLGAMPTKR